jgi:HAD superfamily hydrolase (TIGR01509 family)
MGRMEAVLFDFSGTLFRLDGDASWFEGITVDEREVDAHVQAELMRRLTAPTGHTVDMTPEAHQAWLNRDLEPHLHREAYLHVLRESGLADHHAETLYGRTIDPSSWTPYPDSAQVLKSLHRQGVKTAVVSNIAFDIRPAFTELGVGDYVDTFVLSYEIGEVKPDAAIFETALSRLGVEAANALMVGDSDEADGGARAVGCGFALVDPLPTVERRDGLISALTEYGFALWPVTSPPCPIGSRRRDGSSR